MTSESGSTPDCGSTATAAISGRPAVTRVVRMLHRRPDEIVDPRLQHVLALLRAVRELVGARVDGDVEPLQPRELHAGGADVEAGVEGQRVHVGRDRRRSPARRSRPSSRARTDRRASLWTRRARRRRSSRSAGSPRTSRASRSRPRSSARRCSSAAARTAPPGSSRPRPCSCPSPCRRSAISFSGVDGDVSERGALDEERVRDAALHAVPAQHDEAVVRARAGVAVARSTVTGTNASPPGPSVTVAGTSICTPVVCACGSTDTLHVPEPSPASVSDEQQRLPLRPGRHVDALERERLRVGEDLRVVGGEHVRQPGALEQHRSPPACARCPATRRRRSTSAPT